MKFLAGLAALVSMAAAAPSAPTPLDVKLEMAGNSAVKATITNNGKNNLKIFRTGTILDSSAIQKTRIVDSEGRDADFHGIRQRISTANLGDAAFERIPAGQSIEVTFNVGEVHDLSAGGKFDIESAGIMQFADENGTKLIGSVPYASNKINTVVDGAKAASMIKSFVVDKRTRVQSDCTGSKGTATKAALSNCVNLANAAKQVAQSGSAAKLQEYFKDSGSATRNTVASVLGKVASECGSTTSGASDYYCTDVANGCEQGVLAYTVPSQSFEAYCDLYFDDLPGLTSQCHAQDQATTTLHEMTHLNQVAGTQDLGYGYANAIRLSNRDALNNADTYALFANAIHSGC